MTPNDDELREELRERCKTSTYFLGKAILGFTDMTPELHGQMCTWIESPTTRKVGLVPRDHLKTSTWTIADTIRRICANPNIRILLGNETATNAAHFLRRIQAVFMRNTLFQWLFPELIPDFGKNGKWSETEMLVPRSNDYPESTVEAIGVGGAVVSRHYNLIKLDDLVGKEASESAEVMKKTVDWYVYAESLLEKPTDEIQLYGTRWAHYDVYDWAMKHERGLDIFFRSAIMDEKAIWPERFDVESLDNIRHKMGSWRYNCQYMNNPVDPEAGNFNIDHLRYYTLDNEGNIIAGASKIPLDKTRTYMRVDPAISEKPGAARSAIIVDAVGSDNRKYLLEAWAKRCQPFEMLDKIFDLQRRYNCDSVGIESVAYQRVLKPIIEREALARGVWLNVIDLKPDTRERKENRIRGMQAELERGLIWIRKEHEEFVDEFQSFPTGATCDLLDAWAYGPQQWALQVEDDKEKPMPLFKQSTSHTGRCELTGY